MLVAMSVPHSQIPAGQSANVDYVATHIFDRQGVLLCTLTRYMHKDNEDNCIT